MTSAPIHRKKPRRLRFNSLYDIRQDAERLSTAKHVDQLGTWTAGQAFEHLAKSLLSSIWQSKAVLPLWNRMIAKVGKPFLLRYGLPAGIQIASISEVAAKEFLPRERVTKNEGLRELKRAIATVSVHEMSARHNLFGKMSHKDWERMHCRHAELHLRLLLPTDMP